MSSTFSTQNRQTFLRRKYCFLVAIALSPPVGRCDALMGRPPLVSAMIVPSYSFAGAGAGAPGMGAAWAATPGIGVECSPGMDGAGTGDAGLRASLFSRALRRFSIFFIFSS